MSLLKKKISLWPSIGKFGLLLTPASGHTEGESSSSTMDNVRYHCSSMTIDACLGMVQLHLYQIGIARSLVVCIGKALKIVCLVDFIAYDIVAMHFGA